MRMPKRISPQMREMKGGELSLQLRLVRVDVKLPYGIHHRSGIRSVQHPRRRLSGKSVRARPSKQCCCATAAMAV
jgi:hypothetical protein